MRHTRTSEPSRRWLTFVVIGGILAAFGLTVVLRSSNSISSRLLHHPAAAPEAVLAKERAERLLSSKIARGFALERVMQALRAEGWAFEDDSYNQRYAATIYRSPNRTQTVVVYLYFDGKGNLSNSEVKVLNTWL
ncbi:MAG: hypothetical protein QM784_30335 [Polyangiaceae bacterium]